MFLRPRTVPGGRGGTGLVLQTLLLCWPLPGLLRGAMAWPGLPQGCSHGKVDGGLMWSGDGIPEQPCFRTGNCLSPPAPVGLLGTQEWAEFVFVI